MIRHPSGALALPQLELEPQAVPDFGNQALGKFRSLPGVLARSLLFQFNEQVFQFPEWHVIRDKAVESLGLAVVEAGNQPLEDFMPSLQGLFIFRQVFAGFPEIFVHPSVRYERIAGAFFLVFGAWIGTALEAVFDIVMFPIAGGYGAGRVDGRESLSSAARASRFPFGNEAWAEAATQAAQGEVRVFAFHGFHSMLQGVAGRLYGDRHDRSAQSMAFYDEPALPPGLIHPVWRPTRGRKSEIHEEGLRGCCFQVVKKARALFYRLNPGFLSYRANEIPTITCCDALRANLLKHQIAATLLARSVRLGSPLFQICKFGQGWDFGDNRVHRGQVV